ncbi:MAG: hypothetical protein M3280_05655 [Actinomycetota bacterium]|nr:hypothetical protein [Actinomycetota bacterium]
MSAENVRLFAVEPHPKEPYEELPSVHSPFQARAAAEGADFDHEAMGFIEAAGGTIEQVGGEADGIPIDGIVRGANGSSFLVMAHGTFSDTQKAGLRRVDTVHKVGHRASMLAPGHLPLLVITSHLPRLGSKAAFYLARSRANIFDVIATTGDFQGFTRLRRYLVNEPPPKNPIPAPWRIEMRQPTLDETERS